MNKENTLQINKEYFKIGEDIPKKLIEELKKLAPTYILFDNMKKVEAIPENENVPFTESKFHQYAIGKREIWNRNNEKKEVLVFIEIWRLDND